MLELIERWITEHGSAAIRGERIEQLRDYIKAREAELAAVTAERDALQAQVEALRAAAEQVRRLQEDADRQRLEQRARGDAVPGDALDVLRAVALIELSTEEIEKRVNLGEERVAVLMADLVRDGYAARRNPRVDNPWSRDPDGFKATDDGLRLLRTRGFIPG